MRGARGRARWGPWKRVAERGAPRGRQKGARAPLRDKIAASVQHHSPGPYGDAGSSGGDAARKTGGRAVSGVNSGLITGERGTPPLPAVLMTLPPKGMSFRSAMLRGARTDAPSRQSLAQTYYKSPALSE
ncbi:hypothetical protein MRX96_015143 [Rhipicephalus microplus]